MNFHNGNGNGPAKRAGENTDYGDYTLLVAEHLAGSPASSTFDVASFIPRWQEALKTWRSWICTQTKQTYQQVQQGVHDVVLVLEKRVGGGVADGHGVGPAAEAVVRHALLHLLV